MDQEPEAISPQKAPHEEEFAFEEVVDEQPEPPQAQQGKPLTEPISWQATEGVSTAKGAVWYTAFGIATVGLMALAILVIKSWTFAILVPIMALAIVLLSSKNSRIINYSVSPKGVYVADKLHDFSEFRSFGVIQEAGQASILLLPVKRLSPGVTIYFDEKDGERIVDMLGSRLPIQEVKPDALEKLIKLIRL